MIDQTVKTEQGQAAGRLRANRLFAVFWDWMVRHESAVSREMRRKVLEDAHGRVLEIGCGTGASLSYYPPDAQVMATDPDAQMLRRAKNRLEELRLKNVELRQAAGEALPFDDASFDHIVSCWVFCHVDDPSRALAEVRRLLKPDGAFRFMEHVRSDGRIGGAMQDLVNPVWRRLLDAGCNVNRRTQQSIEAAGFRVEWLEKAHLFPPTTPGIFGVARAR